MLVPGGAGLKFVLQKLWNCVFPPSHPLQLISSNIVFEKKDGISTPIPFHDSVIFYEII